MLPADVALFSEFAMVSSLVRQSDSIGRCRSADRAGPHIFGPWAGLFVVFRANNIAIHELYGKLLE
jgi:hypothetical protein